MLWGREHRPPVNIGYLRIGTELPLTALTAFARPAIDARAAPYGSFFYLPAPPLGSSGRAPGSAAQLGEQFPPSRAHGRGPACSQVLQLPEDGGAKRGPLLSEISERLHGERLHDATGVVQVALRISHTYCCSR